MAFILTILGLIPALAPEAKTLITGVVALWKAKGEPNATEAALKALAPSAAKIAGAIPASPQTGNLTLNLTPGTYDIRITVQAAKAA